MQSTLPQISETHVAELALGDLAAALGRVGPYLRADLHRVDLIAPDLPKSVFVELGLALLVGGDLDEDDQGRNYVDQRP